MAKDICPIETFEIKYNENFNNLPVLKILDIADFRPVDNLDDVVYNLSLAPGKTKNTSLALDINDNYWAIFSSFKTLLRDRKTISNPLIYYLLADIYKLVLGEAAPTLQFIKSATGLYIGSEFIKNYEPLATTTKICVGPNFGGFPNCKEGSFTNYYTFITLAIMLGERDANERNFGIITPITPNVIIAKIDHDTNIGVCHNLTFQDRILKTLLKGNYKLHTAIKDNLNCLSKSLGNLDSIPNNLWEESINRRLKKLFEVKELFKDPDILDNLIFLEDLANFLIKIKDSLNMYQITLELEYTILQDNVETFISFINDHNIDCSSKYEFMGLRDATLDELKSDLSYGDSFIKAAPNLCTVREYAFIREKCNIFKLLQTEIHSYIHFSKTTEICVISHNLTFIENYTDLIGENHSVEN